MINLSFNILFVYYSVILYAFKLIILREYSGKKTKQEIPI